MNMKDIVESILDGEEAAINRVDSQIKLIRDLEPIEKILQQGSRFSHEGKDMLGNHIEVGDLVLSTSHWTNSVHIGVIVKIKGDDVILSTVVPDRYECTERLDDNKSHVCADTYNIIKIHDPKKFIRTKKL